MVSVSRVPGPPPRMSAAARAGRSGRITVTPERRVYVVRLADGDAGDVGDQVEGAGAPIHECPPNERSPREGGLLILTDGRADYICS